MEGATFIWWEARNQDEIRKHGKISITWYDFVFSIKRQLYPYEKIYREFKKFQIVKSLKCARVYSRV